MFDHFAVEFRMKIVGPLTMASLLVDTLLPIRRLLVLFEHAHCDELFRIWEQIPKIDCYIEWNTHIVIMWEKNDLSLCSPFRPYKTAGLKYLDRAAIFYTPYEHKNVAQYFHTEIGWYS